MKVVSEPAPLAAVPDRSQHVRGYAMSHKKACVADVERLVAGGLPTRTACRVVGLANDTPAETVRGWVRAQGQNEQTTDTFGATLGSGERGCHRCGELAAQLQEAETERRKLLSVVHRLVLKEEG